MFKYQYTKWKLKTKIPHPEREIIEYLYVHEGSVNEEDEIEYCVSFSNMFTFAPVYYTEKELDKLTANVEKC